MKYKHIIIFHLPGGLKTFEYKEDGIVYKITDFTDDIIETDIHPDGSSVVAVSTDDSFLRLRLEAAVKGSTVFPHHFSNRPLSKKHVDLLAHYGVKVDDTMEDALFKITKAHKHPNFHPHTLG